MMITKPKFAELCVAENYSDANHHPVVTQMDEEIGRVLKTLDELKLTENTIVVFASDHGGSRRWSAAPPITTTATTRFAATSGRYGKAASASRAWCGGRAKSPRARFRTKSFT